jgi:hypothetical protein
MYGRGVDKDFKRAAELYEVAAQNGVKNSLTNLGALFETGGFGLEKDERKAHDYFMRVQSICATSSPRLFSPLPSSPPCVSCMCGLRVVIVCTNSGCGAKRGARFGGQRTSLIVWIGWGQSGRVGGRGITESLRAAQRSPRMPSARRVLRKGLGWHREKRKSGT